MLGEDDATMRDRQLEIGQGSSGTKTAGQTNKIINRLPGVFDAPQSPGWLHAKILDEKILKPISRLAGIMTRACHLWEFVIAPCFLLVILLNTFHIFSCIIN